MGRNWGLFFSFLVDEFYPDPGQPTGRIPNPYFRTKKHSNAGVGRGIVQAGRELSLRRTGFESIDSGQPGSGSGPEVWGLKMYRGLCSFP